jgi:hypothetical protein
MPRNLQPFDDPPEDLLEELRKQNAGGPLTHESVERLRQIIAQECGVVLSHREAWGRAIELLALVAMLLEIEAVDDRRTQA